MKTGMTRKSGKTMNNFDNLFQKQMENQKIMIDTGMYNDFIQNSDISLPIDDPKLESYHIQQLVSEIGEILEADKRWKNFRNVFYNKENKLEEIADCFIVLMNIAMFSGFTSEEVYNSISKKIKEIFIRINKQ